MDWTAGRPNHVLIAIAPRYPPKCAQNPCKCHRVPANETGQASTPETDLYFTPVGNCFLHMIHVQLHDLKLHRAASHELSSRTLISSYIDRLSQLDSQIQHRVIASIMSNSTLAGPPGECCRQTVHHVGTPRGALEYIAGVNTYIARPTSGNVDKIILFFSDVYGALYTNSQLVMDYWAESGELRRPAYASCQLLYPG